ncbi:MAG TPA: hypothetical protein VEZ11_13485 [Thermoanaerobaculia bacterium]|nr:hypothetical protein [Thermoanaerobaculia bacterium]
MTRSRIWLAVAVVVVFAVSLFAQEHTVTKVAIVAKPKVYTGPCPADIQFIATIFVSRHPVWVDYQWERSDGAKGERQRVEIRSAGQGIYTTWHLGAGREQLHIWERLHVLAPTGISSPPGNVTVNCR